MKTIHGLNYTLKIKEMIVKTIDLAKSNLFNNYYIIVDDPLFFEEAFFKYTDTLFNINIITYQNLINKLISHYQLFKYSELTKVEKILTIKQLIEDDNNLFNTTSKMDLVYELCNLFDTFYLEGIDEPNLNNLPPLAFQKLTTITALYQQLITTLPENKCFHLEELLFTHLDESLNNNHYIFITETIFFKHRYQLVKQLANYSDVTVLVNDYQDDRLLNQPFVDYQENPEYFNDDNEYLKHLNTYLFELHSPKYPNVTPLHTLIQTTPKAQIESVVLHLYQDLVDGKNHYRDYAIYYPNNEYLDLLVTTLDNFKIPHNIKKTLIFNELNACLSLLKYHLTKDNNDLLDVLTSHTLIKYNDFNYLDVIKKNYLETGFLEDIYSDLYNFDECTTLKDYSEVMSYFIKNEMITSTNVPVLMNFFKNLDGLQTFTLNEFYSLVNELKPSLKADFKPCNDHLYLLNYNQCYSGILNCKKTYLVGVNETIVPKQFKDTGILLDQDLQTLNLPDLNQQIALDQNNILKAINSNLEFIAICFSNATIDGQPLLESSLYSQLKKMFKLTKIDINIDYLHHSLKANLYRLGAKDIDQTVLNQMVDRYRQSHNQPNHLTAKVFSNHLSASKLETYNGCPYKYFNQYGLKLYPFKQPLFQVNEIGSIVHDVLDHTRDLFSDNKVVNEMPLDNLDNIINEYVSNYLHDHDLEKRLDYGINHFIIKMIKQDLVNTIIVLANQIKAGDFKIIDSEANIACNFPNFFFTGKVDRIDQYDNYLKIIDYKSSNKDFDISLAMQGFNIQMLLYLDILTKQKNLNKGGLLYFNTKKRILASSLKITETENSDNFFKLYKMNGYVNEEVIAEIDNNIERDSAIIKAKFVKKDDCFKGNILSSFEFVRLVDYVSAHIEKLYQELISGNIAISPKGSDESTLHTSVNPCTYCNYQSLCNFDVFYNEYSLVDSSNLEHLIKEEPKDAD